MAEDSMTRKWRIATAAAAVVAVALGAFAVGLLVSEPSPSAEPRTVAEVPPPSTQPTTTSSVSTSTTIVATPTTTTPPVTTAPQTTSAPPTTTLPPTTLPPPPPTPTVPAGLDEWSTTYAAMRSALEATDVDPTSSDPCGPRLAILDRHEPQLSAVPTPSLAAPFASYTQALRRLRRMLGSVHRHDRSARR